MDWIDDADSRVDIVDTALQDLRGVAGIAPPALGEALAGLRGRLLPASTTPALVR